MNTDVIVIIMFGFLMVISIIGTYHSKSLEKDLNKINKRHAEILKSLELELEPTVEDHLRNLKYSNKLLEFIKMIVGTITVLKFRSFKDSHDMTKITKSNVQDLVKEIAESSYTSIELESIDFECLNFTKEFYEQYIVDTAVIYVKESLIRTYGEADELI
jgi:sulfur relay (sulfurtransferase) DsrC/TusE family protein